MREIDTLHPAVAAADYLISGLGKEGARIVMHALRAGWLTPSEAEQVEPLAVAIAYLLEESCPAHRDRPPSTTINTASTRAVANRIAEHLERTEE